MENTEDRSRTGWNKEREYWLKPMEKDIKESGLKDNRMEMAYITLEMELKLWRNGQWAKKMEWELYTTQMVKYNTKDSSKTT